MGTAETRRVSSELVYFNETVETGVLGSRTAVEFSSCAVNEALGSISATAFDSQLCEWSRVVSYNKTFLITATFASTQLDFIISPTIRCGSRDISTYVSIECPYKPVSSLVSRLDDEDGWEMLVAAAAAAAGGGTWTDSALHQPGCIITRQQNYPHRLSYVACTGRRSDQRRYRKSSERQPSAWI